MIKDVSYKEVLQVEEEYKFITMKKNINLPLI